MEGLKQVELVPEIPKKIKGGMMPIETWQARSPVKNCHRMQSIIKHLCLPEYKVLG